MFRESIPSYSHEEETGCTKGDAASDSCPCVCLYVYVGVVEVKESVMCWNEVRKYLGLKNIIEYELITLRPQSIATMNEGDEAEEGSVMVDWCSVMLSCLCLYIVCVFCCVCVCVSCNEVVGGKGEASVGIQKKRPIARRCFRF